MTALSKPLHIPTNVVVTKPKTALKVAPTKPVQIKAKPPVKTRTIAKPVAPKPVTSTTIVSQEKKVVTAVKPIATTSVSKSSKVLKPKKVKLVRDSFTIPKSEYLVLDDLKLRAAELKHPVKKGELLRAGIKALAAMTATELHAALQAVPTLKTGRPSK